MFGSRACWFDFLSCLQQVLEAHCELEIGNLFLQALDFALGAFDWRQADKCAQIDKEHWRDCHHQLAHVIAVKLDIALHGKCKANQAQSDEDHPVDNQENSLTHEHY